MASQRRERAAGAADAAIERIRQLNERIMESVRQGGDAALEAYERTLKIVADYQEAAGKRGPDWVGGFAKAQAAFTRELAEASPAAARALRDRMEELTSAATRQARRGVQASEGAAAQFTEGGESRPPRQARRSQGGATRSGSRSTSRTRRSSGAASRSGSRSQRSTGSRAQRSGGSGSGQQDVPIANYDNLSANEVVKRLSRLSKANLGKVEQYERSHKNRKTVLDRIERAR